MDCPNVCTIIHWSPSGDIEQYMQETGRARRDGLPTEAVLYNVPLKGVEVNEKVLLKYSYLSSSDSPCAFH